MKQTKPIIHGRDHLPGGADPMLTTPAVAGDYPLIIASLPDLRGYWRLGEGTPPYADTSGFNLSNPADLGVNPGVSGSTPITGDVTPGLLPASFDDGAIGFNHEGNEPSTPGRAFLEDPDGSSYPNFDFGSTHPTMSVLARIKPATATHTFWGGIVSDVKESSGPPVWDGWGLQLRFPTMEVQFFRGSSATAQTTATSAPIVAGQEYTVVGTYDGVLLRLYIDGVLVATSGDETTIPAAVFGNQIHIGGYNWPSALGNDWRPFFGVIDEAAVYGSTLTDTDVANLHAAATGAVDSSGLVLGIKDDGSIGWVEPKVAVTVNGTEPTGSPQPPATPTVDPDPATSWILDQPYTGGGPDFDVPPNKWTTIPFSTPHMVRLSRSTAPTELDWDDPAAAGWINPDTPRVFTVPHDMPFSLDEINWMQISLHLETPAVLPTTSRRGLRVFETTHQKTVLEATTFRDLAVYEHGAIDVLQDGGTLFATGGSILDDGDHPNTMYAPSSGYGWHMLGNEWLPKTAGEPTLKKGMRLIAQVWHDAPSTLTFHCTATAPYRPHFAVVQGMPRTWGPPWSDWPV